MKSFKHYIEEADKKDSITLDIPLLIRILELAREDVKDDMELHKIVERLIDIRNKGMLTMDDYSFIAKLKEECELDESKPYTHNLIFTDKNDNLVNSASISVKKDKHVAKKVKERVKLLKTMFGKKAGVKLSSVQKYVNENGRCWTGYKPKPGKKAYSKGSCVKEDGMGAGAAAGAAGPTNVVGSGAIAGTGGKGGEPGVDMKKKKRSPVLMSIKRK